ALAVVDEVAGVVRIFHFDGEARFIAVDTISGLVGVEGSHAFVPRFVVAADLDGDGVRDDLVLSGVVGTGVVAGVGIIIPPEPIPLPDPAPVVKGGFRRAPRPPSTATPGSASVFVLEDGSFDPADAKEFRSPSLTPESPGPVAVAELVTGRDAEPRVHLLIPLPGERSVAVV